MADSRLQTVLSVIQENSKKWIKPAYWQQAPLASRILAIALTGGVLFSIVVYGVSVYFESQILDTAQKTREIELDNQDLQIKLDRVRSYNNVAKASGIVKGLKVAQDVMDVAAMPQHAIRITTAPNQTPPKEAYGY